jgi:integrase
LDITQITFHELRHTHATRLLQDNQPIKVVSERLGHSGVTITMEIYQKVLPSKHSAVAKYLEDSFMAPIGEQETN